MPIATRARTILALKTLACAFLLLGLCALQLACGQTASVDLKTPAPSHPEAPEKPAPGAPGNNSDGGQGETPSGTGSMPPGAQLPIRTRPVYRFACYGERYSSMSSFTSVASQTEQPHSIFFDEFSRDSSGTPSSQLAHFSRAVLLQMPMLDRLTAVMRAEYDEKGVLHPLIYSVDADLLYGAGHAVPIADVVEANYRAKSLATELTIEPQLREFGGSSEGRYLIAPAVLYGRGSSSSLAVFSASNMKRVGTFALDPSVNFFPTLDEASGIASVLTFDREASTFANRFFATTSQDGTLRLKSAPIAGTLPSSGETATGPAMALGTERWWMERSKAGVRIVRFDLKTLKIERLRLPLAKDAQLFPQIAPLRIDGRTEIVTALENIEVIDPYSPVAKGAIVRTAKFQVWSVEAGLLKLEGELSYPDEVLDRIKKSGYSEIQSSQRKFAVLSLFATPDGQKAYATLPGSMGNKLFRISLDGIVRLTDGECKQASVIIDRVTPVAEN
jgi:hypothetical protein